MAAAAVDAPGTLADRLPRPRGKLRFDAPLGARTWFRVGGPADAVFQPADEDDLAVFLAETPTDVPVTVIGAGSNLLVRDGGVAGVVVRLGGALARIETNGLRLTAGGGARDLAVALRAQDAGIGRLAFLSGVPGSVGGAVRMNAGAYGGETRDVLSSVRAVDRTGRAHAVDADALDLRYRRCGAPADWIFTQAMFAGTPDAPADIAERIDRIRCERAEAQPTRARTGGSTFKNPPGAKAWALIDRAGCRGLRMGGAQVSEKHCNFLIAHGGSAAEVEALGEEVRRRVLEATGVALDWEIERIGRRETASCAAA